MALFDRVAGVVRRLGPAGPPAARAIELYGRGLSASERLALQALRARLDTTAPPSAPAAATGDDDPAALMSALLERSLAQDTASEQRDVHVALLRQLVPDEARIIAALATGPPPPLIHVLPRS